MKFLKFALVMSATFAIFALMARLSGLLLLVPLFVILLGLAYVAQQIIFGAETPYPRYASGLFEREDREMAGLSTASPCESCTDDAGDGVRVTTHEEFVFLGVPLARLNTRETMYCELCADPLGAMEGDYIDRELERELETEEVETE